jgi:phosphoribosylformylglycinamidine synthase subunit PurQ / glutaminase
VPRFAVLVFPGSNCEEDVKYALEDVLGERTDLVWHKETSLAGYDAAILPGGFAHGDYLRPGALARFSPVMEPVREMAEQGKPVIGICNGFQMLQEAALLPGAMLRNRTLTYICRYVELRVEHRDSPLTATLEEGEVLRIPIGHADGNYYADEGTLDALEKNGRVLFRYVDNPNGAERSIAGIRNERGNVVGLMPHPDRCYEPDLGTEDGRRMFESLVAWTKEHA